MSFPVIFGKDMTPQPTQTTIFSAERTDKDNIVTVYAHALNDSEIEVRRWVWGTGFHFREIRLLGKTSKFHKYIVTLRSPWERDIEEEHKPDDMYSRRDVALSVQSMRKWDRETPFSKKEAKQIRKFLRRARKAPVQRFQWRRSKGNSQEFGNQTIVAPLNERLFQKYVKPFLTKAFKSYADYGKRYPYLTHLRVSRHYGDKKWHTDKVGTMSGIIPRSKWVIRVDSFKSKRAKKWARKAG